MELRCQPHLYAQPRAVDRHRFQAAKDSAHKSLEAHTISEWQFKKYGKSDRRQPAERNTVHGPHTTSGCEQDNFVSAQRKRCIGSRQPIPATSLYLLTVYARSAWNRNKTVPTRHDYMLEQRFLHAGKPLCTKVSLGCLQRRSRAPAAFTSHQWVLIEIILSVFAPFEQLTKEISSSDALVADVIPSIAVQKRLWSEEDETDHGEKKQWNVDSSDIKFLFYLLKMFMHWPFIFLKCQAANKLNLSKAQQLDGYPSEVSISRIVDPLILEK